MSSDVRLVTGQFNFDDGVDSSKVPLIQSAINPSGLKRSQIAWGSNLTCRGGGLTQRYGWQPLVTIADGTTLYQGGWLYDASVLPAPGNPYLMLSIGGRMIQVRVDTDNSVHDVTGAFPDPANVPQAYFTQGERFMVKQAGDGTTLPLFWDGVALRRSVGLAGGPPAELPAATSMTYYMGHIWYANGRIVAAGDMVDNTSSGTAPYNFDDSILKETENPLTAGGDGFRVPATAGNIRALNFPIALDQTLGQGPLFIFTPKQIYSLTVPVSREDWINSTNTGSSPSTMPLLRVVMNNNGTVSERSVVSLNGDLFYQSLDPAIRSFFMALRYFSNSWGNRGISNNINRILQFNDRSLMHVASGWEFGGRLYQTQLPIVTPCGIAHQALAVLDLDPITTLQDQKPPAWDGSSEGLDILQGFSGNFGGLERAFAIVRSRVDGSIQVWEFTSSNRFENGDNRVGWYFESPSFDFSEYPRSQGGGPFELKEIDGLDLWLDRVYGTVDVTVQFRPDEDACWYDWAKTTICAARTSCEDINNPVCYPLETKGEQYRVPLGFPKPSSTVCSLGNNRPVTWGYKFQLRISIRGWCRVRGYHLYCLPKDAAPFYAQVC
jgi:hypothetical protein